MVPSSLESAVTSLSLAVSGLDRANIFRQDGTRVLRWMVCEGHLLRNHTTSSAVTERLAQGWAFTLPE
ncbi:MAG TPA: hypothetical protein VHX87_11050 [Galbitalea sp.]|nr:hypothetical protein [Galbitalea sp.]